MRLSKYDRTNLSRRLHHLTTKFYNDIPIQDVINILNDFNLVLLQEDTTEWSGFICGKDGHTIFDLGIKNSKDDNGVYAPADNRLYFYWYKFDSTGRYEINMYIV